MNPVDCSVYSLTKPFSQEELMRECELYNDMGEYDVSAGQVSGTCYGGEEEMTEIVTKVRDQSDLSNFSL